MFRKLTNLLLSLIIAAVLPGCVDEIEVPGGGPIPDGISTFDAEVAFKSFTPALESRSAGQSIKAINTLWVVIYDGEGNFVKKEEVTNFSTKDLDTNTRPDGKPSSEEKTGCATFKLTLRNGWYKMYAVANFDLSKFTDEEINTEDKLRSLRMSWDESDPAKNAEMLGYFVEGIRTSNKDESWPNAPKIGVRSNATKLHSWVRRAASKVTVAFDTRTLRDNIKIYIRSVGIYDIPKSCALGVKNEPEHKDSLIHKGEMFYFGNAGEKPDKFDYKTDHGGWHMIANGDSIYGMNSEATKKTFPSGSKFEDRYAYEHTDEAPALFFYENMQGEGVENTVTDKRQDITGKNNQVSFPHGSEDGADADPTTSGWKDAMIYGSYIEVDGYYENNDSIRPGRGPIKYRFMLGKDVIKDYNSERNHHYKLTLKFNGHANDIDWHIDYDEEGKPGFVTPDTAYVSYLYNQPASLTARATPKPGYVLTKITAVIVDNEWRPYNGDQDGAIYNKKAWDMQTSKVESEQEHYKFYGDKSAEGILLPDELPDKECARNCEFGFLSLVKVNKVNYELGVQSQQNTVIIPKIKKFRQIYFAPIADDNGGSSSSKAVREYTGIPLEDTSKQGLTTYNSLDGNYTIHRTTKTEGGVELIDYVAILPLYTRAKTLDSWCVYSGANPFYQHHRYARVKYTAHYKKVDPNVEGKNEYDESSYTVVLQARRIDNPRGIYRRHYSTEPFHVNLKYSLLNPIGNKCFQSVVSDGPWSATIEQDPHGIVTLTHNGQTAAGKNSMITGKTNTQIDFMVLFKNLNNPEANYGAIITVRYHNNTCVHKILVRQGYAPMAFHEGQEKWSCFNVFNKDTLCINPLSQGSLFRRYKDLSWPIAMTNDMRSGFGLGRALTQNDKLEIIGQEQTNFLSIPAVDLVVKKEADKNFGEFKLHNPYRGTDFTYKLPNTTSTQNDLINNNDINFAFGIVYADGATETLDTAEAYSFYDPKNKTEKSKMGMRGVIAYCLNHGDNVFFPMGITGHLRRKRWEYQKNDTPTRKEAYGLLHYGNIDQRMGGDDGVKPKNDGGTIYDNYRPMAYNLKDQEGACYWLSDKEHIALDFNYGNYMTAVLGLKEIYVDSKYGANNGLSDALPIRPVLVK